MTFFHQNRPPHVKTINDLPLDMCLCSYHENFIQAVDALHKYVPNVLDYKKGFVRQFLCKETSADC